MKKNKIFSLLLAILFALSLFSFVSCEQKPTPPAHFVAKVTEVHEKQLFVTVIDKGTSVSETARLLMFPSPRAIPKPLWLETTWLWTLTPWYRKFIHLSFPTYFILPNATPTASR